MKVKRLRSCPTPAFLLTLILSVLLGRDCDAQQKIRISYSSSDTINSIWTVADEAGFYKKHGLDAEVIYIGSTTIGVAAIVSQDVHIGNAAGSGVANAALRGADVSYVLVTTPDPLAIREVQYFADRLRSEGMRPDAFVVNRVNPQFSSSDERIASELTAAGLEARPDLVAKCKEALRDASQNGRMDKIHLLALEPVVDDYSVPVATVPTFASDVYNLEALSEIARMLAPSTR